MSTVREEHQQKWRSFKIAGICFLVQGVFSSCDLIKKMVKGKNN